MLGSEPITRTSYAAGTRDSNGAWVQGAAATTTIYGSPQPATDEDMQSLPEGERRRSGKRVYTPTALHTVDQVAGKSADVLTIDGVAWQVRRCDRQRSVIPHYKAIATRVQA